MSTNGNKTIRGTLWMQYSAESRRGPEHACYWFEHDLDVTPVRRLGAATIGSGVTMVPMVEVRCDIEFEQLPGDRSDITSLEHHLGCKGMSFLFLRSDDEPAQQREGQREAREKRGQVSDSGEEKVVIASEMVVQGER